MKREEERISERRRQILTAAATLFGEKGFHATTVRDIARAAGIADGTIYLYFESKTALLLGLFEAVRESLPTALDPETLDSLDVRSGIRTLISYPLLGSSVDQFDLFRVMLAEIMVNGELRSLYREKVLTPTVAMAEGPLRRWMAQGKIRPMDAGMLARVLSAVIYGVLLERVIGEERLIAEWSKLPDILTEMILIGIGVEER